MRAQRIRKALILKPAVLITYPHMRQVFVTRTLNKLPKNINIFNGPIESINFTNTKKATISLRMESIAKRLENLRKTKGLTQKEVATRMKIPASTYRDWEYGKQIKGEPYVKLAGILDVSLTELLTGRKETVHTRILADLNEIARIVECIRKTASAT